MTAIHVKRAGEAAAANAPGREVAATVARMLAEIEADGEAATRRLARELDGWTDDIVVPRAVIEAAAAAVPAQLRDDIRYARDNIAAFARAQRGSIREVTIEPRPGLTLGQKLIPVGAVGAYVPGGRYSHVASALMTVTTARVAGVGHVTAASPPQAGRGIAPAILYALHEAGADSILALGGVQAVAALAFGQFGQPAADILVGPGNAHVAEAKRQLFGRVGIDMVAGPTDCLIIADATAEAATVAGDLVAQAEHGPTSPVWLVTDCAALAAEVARAVPGLIAALPEPNRAAAAAAWDGRGEIILCDTREEMAAHADARAPEHLHVQAADPGWWRERLRVYGSLFLGAAAAVAFGDKAAGTNHVLPTSGAARYTGGLSVLKFLKVVTWQEVAAPSLRELAEVSARIARAEGMEGHARSAEARLAAEAPCNRPNKEDPR